MAIHKVKVEWTDRYESKVYIEADSKEEAMEIVKNNPEYYVDPARENTYDGYLGLVDARMSGYAGIEEDESYMPDNIEED